jgi:HSP20 family protein
MDMDKLKQWLNVAQGMQGGDFWNNIFDQDFSKQFINDNENDTIFKGETKVQADEVSKRFPIIDLLENEQEVIVLIEIPGIHKENIELGLNGKILTIKGSVKSLYPLLKLTYSERFYGEFQRQINLPDLIEPQELTAKFWNGLLLVKYNRPNSNSVSIPID